MEQDIQSTSVFQLSEDPELLAMALDELQARMTTGRQSIDQIWENLRRRYSAAAEIHRS